MSNQRTQLILKLARPIPELNNKQGVDDIWQVSGSNHGSTNNSDEVVNRDTITEEILNKTISSASSSEFNEIQGYDLQTCEGDTDVPRNIPVTSGINGLKDGNGTDQVSLPDTETNTICDRSKETEVVTADINDPTKSVDETNLPNQTDIPRTKVITPDIVRDESSEDRGGVELMNKSVIMKDSASTDKFEESAVSKNFLPSVDLMEEEATSSKVLFYRPATEKDDDSSSGSSTDSSSSSSEGEPYGSGNSAVDPDFEAEMSSSSSSSESEEDRPQSVTVQKRRSVKYPSEAEKKTRKRKRLREEWQKNRAKRLRNMGQTYESIRKIKKDDGSIEKLMVKREERKMSAPCDERCRLKCSMKIPQDQREKIFDEYWQLGDLQKQRGFISSRMMDIKAKYRYPKPESRRRLNSSFFFDSSGQNIRICKKFFMATLGISSRIIRTVIEKQTSMTKGILKEEMRGKHANHNSVPKDIKDEIRAHINSIPRIPSHYCRSQTKKDYIEGGKSVSDLYRDYRRDCQENNKPYTNYLMYYNIFNQEFNISFFTPKKDECELCQAYKNASQEEKEQIQNKYHTHLREKELSRSEKQADKASDKVVTVYDLQAILPCPIGNASGYYYVSKLNTFNLTMYELQANQAFCYLWHEGEAKRGADEIGSCVWNYLQNLQQNVSNSADKSKALDVIFYTDNCAGQNKNRFIISLYMYAVSTLKSVQSITHKFLITGHTQNEGDHVHSVIEKAVTKSRKSGPIYVPEQYATIIRQAKKTGKSFSVHEMCHKDILDLKDLSSQLGMKTTLKNAKGETVKMTELKMFIMLRKESPGVLFYKTSYEEEQFSEVKVLNMRRQQPDFSSLRLKNAYKQRVGITDAKKQSILSLFHEKPEKRIVPMYYLDFYSRL